LSDAYAFLALPPKSEPKVRARKVVEQAQASDSNSSADAKPSPETSPEPVEQPQPRRRHKSKQSIMNRISPEVLESQLKAAQLDINEQLGQIIAQIGRQDHAAWPQFPDNLIARGAMLYQQGERLKSAKTVLP
jgi:hypothetical protein